MAESFENDVLPVVTKFAGKALKDEGLQATAIVLAWWYWANRPKDLPASVWARCGVRAALAGRDLPGLASKFRDVWDHLTHWSGAGMQDVVDRRPGPDKLAADREALELFLAGLGKNQRAILEMVAEGIEGQEIARRLHRSPARISQVRRAMEQDWESM